MKRVAYPLSVLIVGLALVVAVAVAAPLAAFSPTATGLSELGIIAFLALVLT